MAWIDPAIHLGCNAGYGLLDQRACPDRDLGLRNRGRTGGRPGSVKGVLFILIEVEAGHANVLVWPRLFQQHHGTGGRTKGVPIVLQGAAGP